MDEYTIRIEYNGVELWHKTFDFVPSLGCVWSSLGADWTRLFAAGDTCFNFIQCNEIMTKCNSIPGECPQGLIYLNHVWKLRG